MTGEVCEYKILRFRDCNNFAGIIFLQFDEVKINFAIHPIKVQLDFHWRCCRNGRMSQLVLKRHAVGDCNGVPGMLEELFAGS